MHANAMSAGTSAVPVSDADKRDALLGAICHDLRAPLAAVMMGANFMLRAVPEDDPGGRSRRVLEAIVRSCRQMERLVHNFGDLSEIEAGAVVLRPAVHDACAMIEMATEAARGLAEVKSVTLEVVRPDEQVLVQCDRDRILRALGHIVDNAIHFAPDGTSVTLRLADEPDAVRFSVTDRGPGLPEETQSHIYDRAWHVARADREGAGLGLAIARGFILAHGGSIGFDVDPKPETTFWLLLPKHLA